MRLQQIASPDWKSNSTIKQKASELLEILRVDANCVVCDQNKNLYLLSLICSAMVYVSDEVLVDWNDQAEPRMKSFLFLRKTGALLVMQDPNIT